MFRKLLLVVLPFLFATAAVAQDANYKIRSGDTLSIEVLEDASLNRQVLVLPDGNISVPLAGTIVASGRTVGQVKTTITDNLAPNFVARPTVFVSVLQIATAKAATTSRTSTINVYLIGEVTSPGVQQIPKGTTILQFLAQSGGFTKYAAKKRLQLRRTDHDGTVHVYPINYRNIELGLNVSIASTVLANGDVIVVPERRLFE